MTLKAWVYDEPRDLEAADRRRVFRDATTAGASARRSFPSSDSAKRANALVGSLALADDVAPRGVARCVASRRARDDVDACGARDGAASAGGRR